MLLLDTCALIWLADGGKEFSPKVFRTLRAQAHVLQVSAISAFEIAVLSRKGRIELPEPPDRWYADVVQHHELNEIPVTGRIAAQAALLPPIHSDPCDRIILATALAGNLHIVTADQTMPGYPGITVIWS